MRAWDTASGADQGGGRATGAGDMEKWRAGGWGTVLGSTPPQTLRPLRPWAPAPSLPRPQTRCVHTQADSQQRQKEQWPLVPAHGATVLRRDGVGLQFPPGLGVQAPGLM